MAADLKGEHQNEGVEQPNYKLQELTRALENYKKINTELEADNQFWQRSNLRLAEQVEKASQDARDFQVIIDQENERIVALEEEVRKAQANQQSLNQALERQAKKIQVDHQAHEALKKVCENLEKVFAEKNEQIKGLKEQLEASKKGHTTLELEQAGIQQFNPEEKSERFEDDAALQQVDARRSAIYAEQEEKGSENTSSSQANVSSANLQLERLRVFAIDTLQSYDRLLKLAHERAGKNNNEAFSLDCPISYEPFSEEDHFPMRVLSSGHTISKAELQKWFHDFKQTTCPCCHTESNRVFVKNGEILQYIPLLKHASLRHKELSDENQDLNIKAIFLLERLKKILLDIATIDGLKKRAIELKAEARKIQESQQHLRESLAVQNETLLAEKHSALKERYAALKAFLAEQDQEIKSLETELETLNAKKEKPQQLAVLKEEARAISKAVENQDPEAQCILACQYLDSLITHSLDGRGYENLHLGLTKKDQQQLLDSTRRHGLRYALYSFEANQLGKLDDRKIVSRSGIHQSRNAYQKASRAYLCKLAAIHGHGKAKQEVPRFYEQSLGIDLSLRQAMIKKDGSAIKQYIDNLCDQLGIARNKAVPVITDMLCQVNGMWSGGSLSRDQANYARAILEQELAQLKLARALSDQSVLDLGDESKGLGVEQNTAGAMTHFKAAAAQGESNAQRELERVQLVPLPAARALRESGVFGKSEAKATAGLAASVAAPPALPSPSPAPASSGAANA